VSLWVVVVQVTGKFLVQFLGFRSQSCCGAAVGGGRAGEGEPLVQRKDDNVDTLAQPPRGLPPPNQAGTPAPSSSWDMRAALPVFCSSTVPLHRYASPGFFRAFLGHACYLFFFWGFFLSFFSFHETALIFHSLPCAWALR